MEKTFLISIALLLIQMQFVLSRSNDSRQGKAVSNPDLMSIKKIPGTDLFTGVFYKVGMKKFPQGWVTWTGNNGYLEIEINPNDLPNYVPGGPSQYDNQWVFGVTEFSDAFTFANRGKPLGLLTWATAEVGSGNYVAIYDDPSSVGKMSQGGEWRVDALWTPIATDEKNMYKVSNKRKSDKFLNWTWKMHNKYNYYLQLAYDGQDDSKLSFKVSNLRLEALIHDFEFQQPLFNIIESRKTNQEAENVTLEYKIDVPNPSTHSMTSFVFENVQLADQIGIFFDQTFNMLTKTSVAIDQLTPSGTTEFAVEGGFQANKTIAVEVRKTIPAKQEIEVPSKNKEKVPICTEWGNDIEMPFNAKMTVTGITERMAMKNVNTTMEGPIPGDALKDMLNISGDSIEILHESEKELVVLVSGVLRGNIAIKTFVGSLGSDECDVGLAIDARIGISS